MSNFISKKISDFTALTYNELYDNKDNLVLLLSEPGVNNYKVNISELTLALEENIKHELDSELLSYTHELGSKIDNIETNYATKEYINSEINKLNSYIDNIENNYATQEYIDNEINNINSYIDNIKNNYATKEYINGEINNIKNNYATQEYVNNELNNSINTLNGELTKLNGELTELNSSYEDLYTSYINFYKSIVVNEDYPGFCSSNDYFISKYEQSQNTIKLFGNINNIIPFVENNNPNISLLYKYIQLNSADYKFNNSLQENKVLSLFNDSPNMDNLFENSNIYDIDFSKINIDSIETLSYTFSGAKSFNTNKKYTDILEMFSYVNDLTYTFANASNFIENNIELNNIYNINDPFYDCGDINKFTININNEDTDTTGNINNCILSNNISEFNLINTKTDKISINGELKLNSNNVNINNFNLRSNSGNIDLSKYCPEENGYLNVSNCEFDNLLTSNTTDNYSYISKLTYFNASNTINLFKTSGQSHYLIPFTGNKNIKWLDLSYNTFDNTGTESGQGFSTYFANTSLTYLNLQNSYLKYLKSFRWSFEDHEINDQFYFKTLILNNSSMNSFNSFWGLCGSMTYLEKLTFGENQKFANDTITLDNMFNNYAGTYSKGLSDIFILCDNIGNNSFGNRPDGAADELKNIGYTYVSYNCNPDLVNNLKNSKDSNGSYFKLSNYGRISYIVRTKDDFYTWYKYDAEYDANKIEYDTENAAWYLITTYVDEKYNDSAYFEPYKPIEDYQYDKNKLNPCGIFI